MAASITFRCHSCGKRLAAKESSAGKQKTCPQCGAKVTVPEPKGTARRLLGNAEKKDAKEEEPQLVMKPSTQHGDLIDMTAMVDIVFFLLIFFMVTSLQSVEAVIGLPTPQQEGVANSVQAVPDYANDDRYIAVTIDADDTIWVEDQEATSEQDLRAKLRAARREDAERESLFVSCSPDSTHGAFVSVLDAGADAGLKDLKFSVPQTEETSSGGG
jgi:biopolymer transport protein ExbD